MCPLPPPVHGFSVINAHMLTNLQSVGAKINIFDLTPRNVLASLLKWLFFLVKILTPSGGASMTLYLPISGGIRQLVDLTFAIPARLLGFRMFVHHHSFAYLNAKPWFARIAFFVLKDATHITLCHAMRQRLCEQYGIAPGQVRVLSNAAFLEINTANNERDVESSPCITLGFLSNITAEKGIFSFFDAIDGLIAQQIRFKALIAGPVSPEVKAQFDARLAATPDAQYVGAVYGDAKNHFFGQVDLLLFPTLYANEAEPVTLWESMAHGVPVIALQRGCIQGMVPSNAGRVVVEPAAFATAVVEEVKAMMATPSLLAQRRQAARKAFEQARQSSRLNLDSLMQEMTSSKSSLPSP